MISLIKRNLKLYYRNTSGIFFSLMGALISLILYLIFLKQNMLTNWSVVPSSKKLLDLWLMGGTLTVTAVTTTANGMGQMIRDRETGTLSDLSLTGLSFAKLQMSYLISAVIIGTVMQLIMFIIMVGYFKILDRVGLSVEMLILVAIAAVVSSIVWSAFNLLILSYVKNIDSLGKIGTILGTAAGFFSGVYIPIGSVSSSAQTLMKITPAPYNASIYRHILMSQQISLSFKNTPQNVLSDFKGMMGIGIELVKRTTFAQDLLILVVFTFIYVLIILMLTSTSRRLVVGKV